MIINKTDFEEFKYHLFLNDNESLFYLDKLLSKDPNNLLYNYYNCYLRSKTISIQEFIKYTYTEDELNEMLFHLSKTTKYNNGKQYIYNHFANNDKMMFLTGIYNIDSKDFELMSKVKRYNINYNSPKKKSLLLPIITIINVIIILLITYLYAINKTEMSYSLVVLLLSIPCAIIGNIILHYLVKKNNIIYRIIISFILVYLISFVILQNEHPTLLSHLINTVKALVEYIREMMEGLPYEG